MSRYPMSRYPHDKLQALEKLGSIHDRYQARYDAGFSPASLRMTSEKLSPGPPRVKVSLLAGSLVKAHQKVFYQGRRAFPVPRKSAPRQDGRD
jgi:hypothetical protein